MAGWFSLSRSSTTVRGRPGSPRPTSTAPERCRVPADNSSEGAVAVREEARVRTKVGWWGGAAWTAAVGGSILAAAWAPAAPKPAGGDAGAAADATTAVRRSLALIQRGATSYLGKRDCFACHHQAV